MIGIHPFGLAMVGLTILSYVVIFYDPKSKAKRGLGIVGVILTILGLLGMCGVFATEVEETTEWTLCNYTNTTQLEKVIRDREVYILTEENTIEKIEFGYRFETKFKDIDIPLLKKFERYKEYKSGIFEGYKDFKHKEYILLLPLKYRDMMDLWCERN